MLSQEGSAASIPASHALGSSLQKWCQLNLLMCLQSVFCRGCPAWQRALDGTLPHSPDFTNLERCSKLHVTLWDCSDGSFVILEKDNLRVNTIYLSYVFSLGNPVPFYRSKYQVYRSQFWWMFSQFYIDEISMHSNNHTVLLQLYLHEVQPRRMSVWDGATGRRKGKKEKKRWNSYF